MSRIHDSFPYPVLTTVAILPAQPTFSALKRLQEELDANARSVQTTIGNGLDGHLVLVMAPEAFQALPDFVEFAVPVNPGALPVYPNTASERQMKIIDKTFDVAMKAFETYKATSFALKKQLIAACPEIYYDALRHPVHGLSRLSVLDILTHLWSTFGKVNADMYANTSESLHQPFWAPSESIEMLFVGINAKASVAIAAHSPFPDKMLAAAAYKNIEATGIYSTYCDQWRAKPENDQTYAQCQVHFRAAFADANRTTAASQGYHGAHAAIKAATPSKEMDQATAFALALTSAVKEAMKEYKPPVAEPVRNKRHKHNPSTTPSSTPNSGTIHYCWIHGETRTHKGSECKMKNHIPGFQESATLQDKMGGSTYVLQKK